MAEITTSSQPQSQGQPSDGPRTSEERTRYELVESYSGPSVHDMISSHTLAENVIKYNSQIFDDEEMALLKRFVNDPDSRDQILKEIRIGDIDGITGQYHGSLAGWIVMRHRTEVGETLEPVLTNDEIDMLKEWFRSEDENSPTKQRKYSHGSLSRDSTSEDPHPGEARRES